MRSRKKEGCLKPSRKLDKRSSRGVMFENEGLRMRTIEINAEVERGQSDIRKLRRENEVLKQQVWTLRDEYDKLENFVKNMDGTTEDEDDEEDESERHRGHQKLDEDTEEDTVETDNLENLQKVYSGKVRSVEYTVRQASVESSRTAAAVAVGAGGVVGCTDPQCQEAAAAAAVAAGVGVCPDASTAVDPSKVPGPTLVKVCVPGEPPVYMPHGESSPDSLPSDGYVNRGDHFNLDQLLDFASSFHYDRRKHLAAEEEPGITITHPSDEEAQGSSQDESPQSQESAASCATVKRRSSTALVEKQQKTTTGSASGIVTKDGKQLTFCKEGTKSQSVSFSQPPEVTTHTTTVTYTRSAFYFAGSLDSGRSQSLGTGLNAAAAAAAAAAGASAQRTTQSPAGPLYTSSSAGNIASRAASASLEAGLPLVSVYPHRTPLVRLNSIEPNTVMVSVQEMPQLWDISTQEIIDELEQQVDPSLAEIRGVRVVGRAAYICLGRRDALQQLLSRGFTVRTNKVPLIDITKESIVVGLTGVPHYIADATLTILLSAFGTIIGEIERRFYKGVDTGERFVRMKLKQHAKLPKYVTVGGCRIILSIPGAEQVAHAVVPEWGRLSPASTVPVAGGHLPPSQPVVGVHGQHPHPHEPVAIPADTNIPVSPDSGQCSEPSSSDKSCDKPESAKDFVSTSGGSGCAGRTEANVMPPCEEVEEEEEDVESPKTSKCFSSKCFVNLKMPERSGSSSSLPRNRDSTGSGNYRETSLSVSFSGPPKASTPTPTPTPTTGTETRQQHQLSAGHVLRVGTLGRGGRQPGEAIPVVPPVVPPNVASPSPGRRHRHTTPSGDNRPPESPGKQRPSSVVFNDRPKDATPRTALTPQYHQHHAHVVAAAVSNNASLTPLANGILRKSSVSEQEALLPGHHAGHASSHHGPTATIKNRLKIGRSMSYDAGKKKMVATEKKGMDRMESISENTLCDDVSDITPLGGGGRRDSEKSSVSGQSKSSGNRKKEVIDLPWCGCWGNGCI
ncbi:uncharacterized protein LOC143041428 [Oratosquilla oratoria]|uniref:uncharacterized protein LOC143041428 n=1 Tax=Oratosquilla oratoria TaxID=337810 RepID=UPI003F76B813